LYDVFPSDTYWNDYFRREDFLPKRDDIIVDIGAAIGDYSLIAAKLGTEVIAIEPSPKSFPIFVKEH